MLTIAYLGPEKTNTHFAALKRFGKGARYLHAPTVDDVFHLVERERADVGVVPIENSLEGAVTHTLDRFIDFKQTPVHVVGEIEDRIQHYLIVHEGIPLSSIKVVYSHPQALAQCREWLYAKLPHRIRLGETSSTAEAVKQVFDSIPGGMPAAAAIGRDEAAKAWGLKATPIPEERENKTRFLVLGLNDPARGRRNKTSVLFALKDRPGALYDALTPFKRARINLTKIESRPSKRKAWEYFFFIDVEGHVSEPRVKRALDSLARSTALLRVLGSYPVR